MNPFLETPQPLEKAVQDWSRIYPRAYDKFAVNPYTKCRIILMNGTEFEANWFSHQFSRHTTDVDLRQALALSRYIDKQQQLKLSLLKPCNETILEHTIGYEQLAVDLTAELAKREKDCYVKKALDFALLEDFDHLYRYSNLLADTQHELAEYLVGRYTEIMPGRPTISHHRFPPDNVRRYTDFKTADKQTALNTMIITAAEQQTMNYYMNVTAFAPNDYARKMYQEIALVEEEHVTQYEDLMDASASWGEMLLWHKYNECYLYWSCYLTECDPYIKSIWEENFMFEVSALHAACDILKRYEHKDPAEVIPDGTFPEPIVLHENIEYVRDVLGNTVQYTSVDTEYERVENLPETADFFRFQNQLTPKTALNPSHRFTQSFMYRNGKDYRFEVAPNPVVPLRCRTEDNTCVGRVPGAAKSTDFTCN